MVVYFNCRDRDRNLSFRSTGRLPTQLFVVEDIMESQLPSIVLVIKASVRQRREATEVELLRREARKQATIERNRQKRIAAGLPPEPVSFAERARLRAEREKLPGKRELNRLEKEFAASIGIRWCGTCKAWTAATEFYKGSVRCKKHDVRVTGKTMSELRAEQAAKREAARLAMVAKREACEEAAAMRKLTLYWNKTVKPLFWKLTADERKEQSRAWSREYKRRKTMERTMEREGLSTEEEYAEYLAKRYDIRCARMKSMSLEELEAYRKEKRRIRDQWRTYRKSIKAGYSACGGRIPVGWLQQQRESQDHLCALCWEPLGEAVEIDHIIPIKYGGENTPENLQITHPACNQQKNDKLIVNFVQTG